MAKMNPIFEERDWVNLDISHRCPLECPRCLRYYYKERGMRIPGSDMSMEVFEKIVDYYSFLIFCGQVSDPIHHPKFIDFLKLIKAKGKRTSIHVSSSYKSLDWFIEAFKANDEAKWTFGIDGLPKDSHKYRIHQDGEKLYKVMLESKKHLKSWPPICQYIPFSYNEYDVEEAMSMAERDGVMFLLNISSRWDHAKGEDGYDPLMPKTESLRLKRIFEVTKNNG